MIDTYWRDLGEVMAGERPPPGYSEVARVNHMAVMEQAVADLEERVAALEARDG